MRNGPHPLYIHLGMALANTKGVQDFVSNFPSHPYSQAQITEMVRGIQMYQAHPFNGNHPEVKPIWSEGTLSIMKLAGSSRQQHEGAAPLLLVPSLINKANILNLTEERSLLKWLNEQRVEAYLLDWGDIAQSGDDGDDLDISDLVQDRLCCAIKALSAEHGRPIDVLGYCMGGTLLVAATHFVREYIRKLVFLAVPWDFHAPSDKVENDLAKMVRILSPSILPEIKRKGYLPSEYTQALFASLGAEGSVHKFVKFSTMDQEALDTELFIAAEDWLNDGIDLPGKIAEECIQGWFLDNKPAKGEWSVGSKLIAPDYIDNDCLVIASRKDNLVPFQSAASLYRQMSSSRATLIEPDMGHVGLIVGKNAVGMVWKPLFEWLCA